MAPTELKLQQDLLRQQDELCILRDLFVALVQEMRGYQFETDAQKRSESKTTADALMGKLMQFGQAYRSVGQRPKNKSESDV
jgi:hypothetical protein